jgi:hypothetical protein
VTLERMMRKVEKRNRRIAGLMRRVAMLESALATKDLEMKRLPRDISRAVQDALCNVRMIPVLGVGKSARIVEVKTSELDQM